MNLDGYVPQVIEDGLWDILFLVRPAALTMQKSAEFQHFIKQDSVHFYKGSSYDTIEAAFSLIDPARSVKCPAIHTEDCAL